MEKHLLPLREQVVSWDFTQGRTANAVVNSAVAEVSSETRPAGLVVDTTTKGEGWFTYLSTPVGLLKGGTRYYLRFTYEVLARDDDAWFCCLVKSATEQKASQWAWKSYFTWKGTPGTKGVKTRRIVLPDYDDFELVFTVRNGARIVIQEATIQEVAPLDLEAIARGAGVVTSPEPAEPFGMCVQTGLPWVYTADGEAEKAMDLCADAGVQWVRLNLAWNFLEPKKGIIAEDLLTRLDVAMNAALQRGIQPYINLLGVPKWASTRPDHERYWAFPPRDMEDWRNYVRLLTARYKTRVDVWEVWNEQDWEFWEAPLEDFVPFLKLTAEELRRSDPGCSVLLGGLATDGALGWDHPDAEENALQRLYDAGAGPCFDILGLHVYVADLRTGGQEALDKVNTTWSIMAQNGDGGKPIWVNEVGCSTWNDRTSEQDQARFMRDVMLLLPLHPRVDKVFWYNLRCTGPDPKGFQENFGIVAHDFAPRAAYRALQLLDKYNTRKTCPTLLERTPD